MPEVIKLRKGLDIKLKGSAAKELVPVNSSKSYALVPDDFVGVTPKVVVAEGQHVKTHSADTEPYYIAHHRRYDVVEFTTISATYICHTRH